MAESSVPSHAAKSFFRSSFVVPQQLLLIDKEQPNRDIEKWIAINYFTFRIINIVQNGAGPFRGSGR
jgi:hypothetical protein